jgi:hypothetical protein
MKRLLLPVLILAVLFAINPKGTMRTVEHSLTWLATRTIYRWAVHER